MSLVVTPRPVINALDLRDILTPLCGEQAIDICGVVRLPRHLPHTDEWLNWLHQNHHAGLEYMVRDPHGRADPTRDRSWARTLIVFAQRYADGWSPDDMSAPRGLADNAPWTDGVSRFARGLDYHDVLRRGIRRVTTGLREELRRRNVVAAEQDIVTVDAVDAGPFLEREYAWLAGFGFYGKNTMLIHPKLGSAMSLGVALTNLEVNGLDEVSRPLVGPAALEMSDDGMMSLCGNCTRCLDACPTDAFTEPWHLDASRCLSAWSIEWRGGAPEQERNKQGGLLFGCDICQSVCPWNHKAARKLLGDIRPEYETLTAHNELDLADLITMDPDSFRTRFRKTPLWRCHPEGMRRNALIVAANCGRADLLPVISRVAADDTDEDVRAVAQWAAKVLEGRGS